MFKNFKKFKKFKKFETVNDDTKQEFKSYGKFVSINYDNKNKEVCEELKYIIDKEIREQNSISILYKYECCEDFQRVVLDRYPLSEKIITKCDVCNKGTHLVLVNPIEFSIPLVNNLFYKKDIEKIFAVDVNNPQYIYLTSILEDEYYL